LDGLFDVLSVIRFTCQLSFQAKDFKKSRNRVMFYMFFYQQDGKPGFGVC